MEIAIRWSPSSTITEQRFLVADIVGRTFKHCNVTEYDGKGLRYETLSTHRQVPAFCAFDWSPHNEDLVAVGQLSGEARILQLSEGTQVLSLPIRQQRVCNAVAFNTKGLLATGLERVRNDFCLNIWDVNQRLLSMPPQSPGSSRKLAEPYRKLTSSEAVTSVKFFANQPETLVAGIKGTCLRSYDLREPIGSYSLQFQTTSVHNIVIDPLDENYFVSVGPAKETTICIWDRRAGSRNPASGPTPGSGGFTFHSPILEIKDAFETSSTAVSPSIWSLHYSKVRSGCLGVLVSTGEYKVFETKKEYVPEAFLNAYHETPAEIAGPYAHEIFMKRVHHVEPAIYDEKHGQAEKTRIVAFDFTNLGGIKRRVCTIVLRGDESIEINELKCAPSAISVSAKATLASTITTTTSDIDNHLIGNGLREQGFGRLMNIRTPDNDAHKAKRSIESGLLLCTTSRHRCAEGYLFDCDKNIKIVSSDNWLREMWAWIGQAKSDAFEDGTVADNVDMSYLGVASIWSHDLGFSNGGRVTNKDVNTGIGHAVELLCARLKLPELRRQDTASPSHRQLCLYVCGLSFSESKLEHATRDLVRRGQNTKAAILSLIYDKPKLAFRALRNGTTAPAHRELSLAIAGFVKGQTDDTWEETVQDVAKELVDPYARAILALVSYGEWHDVLLETSLPLKYRIGIALMHLDDRELTEFIKESTADCIRHGDIEGIILTGLTHRAVPLFEMYIRRYNDFQTAVLALSFVCPRFFSDERFSTWREAYRSSLNTWRLFTQRVHFDIQSTKLSIPSRSVNPRLPVVARQVTLRCNGCDQALDRNTDHISPNVPAAPSNGGLTVGDGRQRIAGDSKSGTSCPKCGRHMPRCVICMMWVGMPDPHSRGGAIAASQQKNRLEAFALKMSLSFLLSNLVACAVSLTVPRIILSGYAPVEATCPTTPLLRPAIGLSSSQSTYLMNRKAKASVGLKAWLAKTNPGFGTSNLPTVALTSSGGGYRALLSGAGVIQGLDARDSDVSTSGVLQGITYQTGLSGGAWLLSSFAGNNYPTITSLRDGLWKQAFQDSLLLPNYLLAATAYVVITNDIEAKQAAGFPPTLTDPWGRLLSYQLLYGYDGGIATTLSSITSFSNFTSYNVPYPIITSLGVKTFQGECLPGPNATTYEFAPYEFGSWDQGVSAFTQTQYLGTPLSNGLPTNGTCINNYDNLGYVLGTSSSLFNEACISTPTFANISAPILADLAMIVSTVHQLSTRDEYAAYPNPFHNYARSSLISAQPELSLVDGGEALQNNPIFPLLQPARGIDVILVNDNSADTSNNFPNGSEILTTYIQSLAVGLTRMPYIPSVDVFISQGLNKRPTFFGCNETSKITIVYLPNVNYTFPSNEPTAKLQYSEAETEGMIANGVEIASAGGDGTWATCLGCAFMGKMGGVLPGACAGCFERFCHKR